MSVAAPAETRSTDDALVATTTSTDRSVVDRWLDWLGECSTPEFPMLVEAVLLLATATIGCLTFEMAPGPRQGPSTLLSWLPESLLSSGWPFHFFRAMLWVGVVPWALGRATPWACWVAVVGVVGLWSMKVENTTNAAHIFHATAMLLVVQAIWRTALAGEIAAANAKGDFWSTPLYPRWAFGLGLFFIGWFHTLAGLAKLWESGLDWANGTSLQLWMHWDGYDWAPSRAIVCRNRSLAIILQVVTLIVETGAILALWRPLRPWLGLGLLGFYLGVMTTFPYGFHVNAVLTGLFFLPVDRWAPTLRRRIAGWFGRRVKTGVR